MISGWNSGFPEAQRLAPCGPRRAPLGLSLGGMGLESAFQLASVFSSLGANLISTWLSSRDLCARFISNVGLLGDLSGILS